MSQPISFEIVGTCLDGEILIVDGWPNMRCGPMLQPKNIYYTTKQIIQEPVGTLPEYPNVHGLWGSVAGLSVLTIGLTIDRVRRRSKEQKRRTDVFHHKA